MKHDLIKNTLTIHFEGEFNSSNAHELHEQANAIIDSCKFENLVLDFDDVSFISSAGLRVVLSLKQKHPNTSVVNTNLEVYDVFEMTGFTSMMSVSKALRKIELGNAELIGDGYFSNVYRLNKDTIVKVFKRTSDPGQIERELKLAKEAFILGIPTAISFDIVRVGDKLGVCFEMLDCMSLQTAFQKDKKNYQVYLEKYAELLKKINTTECFNPIIPDVKKHYLEKVELIKPLLEDKYYQKAKKLIEGVPERKTFVHGDCHFKNIMVQNDELLLIDMDTLSVGHPIFELAALYAPYCAFNLDEPGNSVKFFGFSDEEVDQLYNDLLNVYFGKDNRVVKEKIKLLGHIHMVWWTKVNQPENDVRFAGCKTRLYDLLDKYEDLDIGI